MRATRVRGRALRWLAAIVGLSVSTALAGVACGGSVADATLFGDGDAAASGASERDAGGSPPEQPPPPASPSDAGASDGAVADADAAPTTGPAPPGFVQCGATSCDISSDFCCGDRAECWPRGEPGCRDGFFACDSPSDCPEGEWCRFEGPYTNAYRKTYHTSCMQGTAGFPRVAEDRSLFEMLVCNLDAKPPRKVCPGDQPCIRQSCRGFVFDLCGVIPDGGCDP